MNVRLRSMVLALVAALTFSGCSGTSNDVAPTTTSMAPPPAPKVVYDKHVDACQAPAQTSSIRERFLVDDGFDEIIIQFGESGVGTVTPEIRYPDEDKTMWGGSERTVNTVAGGQACGAHGAHGPGETVKLEPGEYEAIIQYTGTLDLTFAITARSSRDNMTDHDGHTG